MEKFNWTRSLVNRWRDVWYHPIHARFPSHIWPNFQYHNPKQTFSPIRESSITNNSNIKYFPRLQEAKRYTETGPDCIHWFRMYHKQKRFWLNERKHLFSAITSTNERKEANYNEAIRDTQGRVIDEFGGNHRPSPCHETSRRDVLFVSKLLAISTWIVHGDGRYSWH